MIDRIYKYERREAALKKKKESIQ